MFSFILRLNFANCYVCFRNMEWNDLSLATVTNIRKLNETLINSKVSKFIHDQGKSMFCWAFAISTMLRQSLKLFLAELRKIESAVDMTKLISTSALLDKNEFHKQLRNELIMLPIPKLKNDFVAAQAHNVDLAIQRVSLLSFKICIHSNHYI